MHVKTMTDPNADNVFADADTSGLKAKKSLKTMAKKKATNLTTYINLARTQLEPAFLRMGFTWAEVLPLFEMLDTAEEIQASPF